MAAAHTYRFDIPTVLSTYMIVKVFVLILLPSDMRFLFEDFHLGEYDTCGYCIG